MFHETISAGILSPEEFIIGKGMHREPEPALGLSSVHICSELRPLETGVL